MSVRLVPKGDNSPKVVFCYFLLSLRPFPAFSEIFRFGSGRCCGFRFCLASIACFFWGGLVVVRVSFTC